MKERLVHMLHSLTAKYVAVFDLSKVEAGRSTWKWACSPCAKRWSAAW